MRQTTLTLAAICVVLFTSIALLGQSVEAPTGWSVSQVAEKTVYRLTDLPVSESFTLTVDPPSALESENVEKWFMDKVKADATKRGSFQETEPLRRGQLGLLSLERLYRGTGGRPWDVVYVGFPLMPHHALFCLMSSNLAESPSYSQYVHAAGKICGEIAKKTNKSAQTAK
jgi:hypothetical protein